VHDVGFLLLVLVVFTLFFSVAIPGVFLFNRALGASFDEKARAVAPILAQEGILFAEDGVRIRGSWVAPLAVDVRVTPRAIYLMQYTKNFGSRMGQPILALPLRGAILDPRVAGAVLTGWLETYPREEDGAVILRGGLRAQRFTLRLSVRDVAGFLRCS
jgi:hypothetical protein